MHPAQNLFSLPDLALTGGILQEYKREGRPELIAQAEAALDRIASNGTLNPAYLLYLGQVRIYQGRINEARQIFSQIRKFDKLRPAVDKFLFSSGP